jgi:hypothetical protein
MNEIQSLYDIEKLTLRYGFLPFFKCCIPGFSIEEMTPDELWFSDTTEGPWEWKGPVIALGTVAYGKFFRGKAGFVSLECLPDLINWRRRPDAPALSTFELEALAAIEQRESLLISELRRMLGWTTPPKPRRTPLEKHFEGKADAPTKPSSKSSVDGIISRLQMATRVVIADFEYNYTKQGERFGWGKGRYTTPELMYGDELATAPCPPEESLHRIISRLAHELPQAKQAQIAKLII